VNSAFEFHDSKVSTVNLVGSDLELIFEPAYIHRSVGKPGIDPGQGFNQKVHLKLGEAMWIGVLKDCFGTLSDGTLTHEGKTSNLLPIPFESTGGISISLIFQSGERLFVEAKSAKCAAAGPEFFIENFEP
jgi:hypothetical protein